MEVLFRFRFPWFCTESIDLRVTALSYFIPDLHLNPDTWPLLGDYK